MNKPENKWYRITTTTQTRPESIRNQSSDDPDADDDDE